MAVPSAWPSLIGSEVDWGYMTVPQLAAGGMARRYQRGKVLGGSSSINGMTFPRGHRSGYDEWAASGATGWGYADLLPFFKLSEAAERGDRAYRGGQGPMRVAPARHGSPLSFAFLDAAVCAGYDRSDDLNGLGQEGICWPDLNIGSSPAFGTPTRHSLGLIGN